MDDMIFEVVAAKVREFAEPLCFEEKDGCFKKDNMIFCINYDETSKTFALLCKESDGETESESKLSVWLFDETHRKKDAETIGEDFADCIRKKLGIAKERPAAGADVSLPIRAAKKDGALGMEQFTQRFLAIYPQFKDDYKANVSEYGSFMPIDFYGLRAREKFKEVASGNNKKQLDKMLAMLNEFYCEGDRQVADLIMSLFFGGTFFDDKDLFASVLESMGDYPYLKSGAIEVVAVASKNKKFKALYN